MPRLANRLSDECLRKRNFQFWLLPSSHCFLLGVCGLQLTEAPTVHARGIIWSTTYHVTYASNALLDDGISTVTYMQVDHSVSESFNPRSIISAKNRKILPRWHYQSCAGCLKSRYVSTGSATGRLTPPVGPLCGFMGSGRRECHNSDEYTGSAESSHRHKVYLMLGIRLRIAF